MLTLTITITITLTLALALALTLTLRHLVAPQGICEQVLVQVRG